MGMFGGGFDEDSVDRGIWDHPAGPVFPQWVIDAMQRGLARVAAGGGSGQFGVPAGWTLPIWEDQAAGPASWPGGCFDTGYPPFGANSFGGRPEFGIGLDADPSPLAMQALPQDDSYSFPRFAEDETIQPTASDDEAVLPAPTGDEPAPLPGYDFVLTQNQIDRLTGNVSGGSLPASGQDVAGSGVNLQKIADAAKANAQPGSKGDCAKYVRRAFEAGGIDTRERPKYAKDYGPFLTRNGFSKVNPEGYKPQLGDVVVFDSNATHKAGHIAVYDGSAWTSDFRQKSMNPYTGNVPSRTLYRHGDASGGRQ